MFISPYPTNCIIWSLQFFSHFCFQQEFKISTENLYHMSTFHKHEKDLSIRYKLIWEPLQNSLLEQKHHSQLDCSYLTAQVFIYHHYNLPSFHWNVRETLITQSTCLVWGNQILTLDYSSLISNSKDAEKLTLYRMH